jgi:hypothetical protein
MSHQITIKSKHTCTTVIDASDRIKGNLGPVPIHGVPVKRIFKQELQNQGFSENADGAMVREDNGVTTTVTLDGDVEIAAEASEEVTVTVEGRGHYDSDYKDEREEAEKRAAADAEAKAAKSVQDKQDKKQNELTRRLKEVAAEVTSAIKKARDKTNDRALRQYAESTGGQVQIEKTPNGTRARITHN